MRRTAQAVLLAAASALAGCGGAVAGVENPGHDAGSDAPASPSPGRCATNADCTSTQYCERAGTCGTGGTLGSCKARPQGCPDIYSPTCACDGKMYGNICEANAAAVDVGKSPSCAPKTGSFSCGPTGLTCDAATTYCQRTGNDVGGPGQPAEFDQCVPLPSSCVNDTACSCFPKDTPCLSFGQCKEIAIPSTATFGLQILCPGG